MLKETKKKAANSLGIFLRTLYYKLKEYKIEKADRSDV